MFSDKRLFVDNLPECLKESDLKQKFNKYGSVSSVEIKERKKIVNNQSPHFAYIHINIEQQGLNECFNDFYNSQWEGSWVTVQEAKESFMERLKREREEKVAGENVVESSKKPQEIVVSKPKFEEIQRVNVKRTFDDTEEDNVVSDSPAPVLLKTKRVKLKPDLESLDDDFVIKNNKGKKYHAKIESFGKEPVAIIDHTKKKATIECEADRKRLEGLSKWRKEIQQKKAIMKRAISSAVSNKKIRFDEEPEEPQVAQSKSNFKGQSKPSGEKISLFEYESEDENEAINFKVKEQFQGKKGQKLLELQSKFKHDKRFVMDDRFLDEESDGENERETNENADDITMEEEKKKEFEILESVVGKTMRRKKDAPVTESKNYYKMMVRYDPTLPDHEKYEVKKQSVEKKKTHKNEQEPNVFHNLETEATEKKPQETLPEVSKEKFSRLNLQKPLGQKTEFSLSSMFDKEIEERGFDENAYQAPEVIKRTKQSKHFKERNPFKYDSSDDDDDEEEEVKEKTADKVVEDKIKAPPTVGKMWSEPFFFREDDYRLQEADDFIERLRNRDHSDFVETRRKLKEIARAKVKHNIKLNRPFKRKLGGNKKRLRFKKAVKR